MPISIILYISVFCKHNETYLNIGYNLVLSAISLDIQANTKNVHEMVHETTPKVIFLESFSV